MAFEKLVHSVNMTSVWSTSNNHPNPQLTSNECSRALATFLRTEPLISVATEASSHPSGVVSLYAQPYVYSGGGLGNINECHAQSLQVCLAGGTTRDSITFASVCIPPECTALDLASRDFCASLQLVSEGVDNPYASEYLLLHERIAEINKFLDTGWTCGEYKVPWNVWLSGVYGLVVLLMVVAALIGTCVVPMRQRKVQEQRELQLVAHQEEQDNYHQEEKKEQSTPQPSTIRPPSQHTSSLWNAWNIRQHLHALCKHRPDTAALDGLRFGSILWVIFGHVLAIESSSGGGYNNAADFLPPNGFTTTWLGQLLFASRFAVDTFLLISGYLVVHVLVRITSRVTSVWKKYCTTLPGLVVHRLLRIMPLYAMTLGFYVFIAPHMGSGPFWYQWEGLLEPCRAYGWSNLLFVNNFVPFDLPNTATCFYHSWYLALDLQLFIVAPLLVYAFVRNKTIGKVVTASLLGTSILTALYLGWRRKWSLNTFDGTAVARYDVEAYAKPHIRAQAYLAGMLLAMRHQSLTTARRRTTWKHSACMIMALSLLAVVTFGTVTGAYARRPCRYQEWPAKNDCGSIWGPQATLWYTALSRMAWSVAVCVIIDLCLQKHGGIVGDFLSLKCWTPLSHLSFGAYLVHPIVIFIWQLGNTQKETFRFLEVGMNYIAVCVVSFGAALLLAVLVEFPCASLVKTCFSRRYLTRSHDEHCNYTEMNTQHLLPKVSEMSPRHRYGAISYQQEENVA